ncbi:GNAT family N-acetyltransferase [Natrinema altunense]|uniref:GCN5-related N-acetyltransferase n=2 Tax=Natrinema altunense TaxID=222984 RepID=L9ZX85_NATA2|nr:GNAT family N-acetyltransferase [Natrinema altunense]ELY89768.1 GCN5-related N-acetyltransferase [Natrinema altunense JCM 12890]RZH67557.1 N-acetyltransferase [Natrinema altunense]
MDIREATRSDADAIRSIARDSLSSTYTAFIDEGTIDDAIEQWYGDAFPDELADDRSLFQIVERDGDVVGFSQSELVGQQSKTGHLLWLHVHPDHRGDATGVRLLVRTREALLETGADQIRCFVLEDNEGGNEFYRSHGFEQAGQREVEIGDETFTENVYVESDLEDDGEWGAIDEVTVDGRTLYVSYGEATRGTRAPFYTAYESPDRHELYAWFCGNCDSIDNAMDAMGRIECNECGNRRKATRWDASYL